METAASLNATCEYVMVTRHDGDVRKRGSKAVAIHDGSNLWKGARIESTNGSK